MSLPATITVTQGAIGPAVTVADGSINAPAPGLPPYPLATNPGDSWWLTFAGGALSWVEGPLPAVINVLGLEDAAGVYDLEDEDGTVLAEV